MKYVTLRQALTLRALGFKEPCMQMAYKFGDKNWSLGNTGKCVITNNNNYPNCVAVPSVDQAIDWIRRKYSIHIVNRIIPFVDPTKQGKILHSYCVKKTNVKDGWNFREMLGNESSHDIYAAKRMCIDIALRYVRNKTKIIKIRKK